MRKVVHQAVGVAMSHHIWQTMLAMNKAYFTNSTVQSKMQPISTHTITCDENRHGHGSMSLSANRGDLGRTSYFRSRILSKGMIRGLQECVSENTYVALPEGTRMGANGERFCAKRFWLRWHMDGNLYVSQLK